MSETLTAYIISVAILAALGLLVPCIGSLAGLLRRGPRKPDTSPDHSRRSPASATSHSSQP